MLVIVSCVYGLCCCFFQPIVTETGVTEATAIATATGGKDKSKPSKEEIKGKIRVRLGW